MTAQLTNKPPEITESTREERRVFIKNKKACIEDDDMGGICKVYRGMDPEEAY